MEDKDLLEAARKQKAEAQPPRTRAAGEMPEDVRRRKMKLQGARKDVRDARHILGRQLLLVEQAQAPVEKLRQALAEAETRLQSIENPTA